MRNHKKTKLQQNSKGTFFLAIPRTFVEDHLVAEKGDSIEFKGLGNQIILTKVKACEEK
ncbi:MAG: hypothetical protein ACI83O_000912 [Patescibacteria group bacterium]|jgi:hypothetical protein